MSCTPSTGPACRSSRSRTVTASAARRFNYGFSKVDEMKLIAAAVDEATQAKIAVLMLPGLGTVHELKNAHAAGASVARIATHCTEADVSIQHFGGPGRWAWRPSASSCSATGRPREARPAGPDHGRRRRAVRLRRRLRRCAGALRRAGADHGRHRRDRPRGAGRLPRPPEPQPRHRQLGARPPGRRPADRRRAVRPRRRGRQQPHRGARRDLRADGHPHRRRPR